jgi:predicted NAD/FAD-dependent oxidoreductase
MSESARAALWADASKNSMPAALLLALVCALTYMFYKILRTLGKKDESEAVVLPVERKIVCSRLFNSDGCGGADGEPSKMRVAIIGSGASGSVAAYWLRKMGGDAMDVHIYEKNDRLGGRVRNALFQGRVYETGATIFHSSNRYTSGFCRLFNLTKLPVKKKGSRSGVFDGTRFVFKSSGWSSVDSLLMIWEFGLWPLLRLSHSVNQMIEKFSTIYTLQSSGRSFSCPQDLVLAFAGTDGLHSMHVDGQTHLVKSLQLSESFSAASVKLVRNLVSAGTRCNYGQTAQMLNGLCAQVSCAGTQSEELYYIKGSNDQLVNKLVHSSKATVHLSTTVKTVHQSPDGCKFEIGCHSSVDSKSTLEKSIFDAVIVACPVEGSCSDETLNFVVGRGYERNLNDAARHCGFEMHRTVVTFVCGVLSTSFQGLSAVYTESVAADSNLPWNSVGLLYPVDAPVKECMQICQDAQAGKPSVFKVFSQRPLSEAEMLGIFSVVKVTEVVADWKAYPHYGFADENQRTRHQEKSKFEAAEGCYPFVVSSGVFSTCAIERVSSAVEMALISGLNAALLVREHLITTRVAAPAL